MSNSIAPGSSADVNVKVTALTINPNVPAQYKTIILKKNLVNGVNTLTQEMMSATNIKYIIKYDFTLVENITIPTNCVLEFDGGSINGNATLIGNDTVINGGLIKIFGTDISFSGSWKYNECYPEWWGAKGDDINDDTKAFQSLASFITNIGGGRIYIPDRTYKVTESIYINGNIEMYGCGKNSIIHTNGKTTINIGKGNTEYELIDTTIVDNVGYGETEIKVTDASKFNVGEYYVIQDTVDFSFYTSRAYYRQGEIIRIKNINIETNTISLYNKTVGKYGNDEGFLGTVPYDRNNFTGNFQTALDVNHRTIFVKWEMHECYIHDFSVVSDTEYECYAAYALHIRCLLNSKIERIYAKTNKGARVAMRVDMAYNTVIEQCIVSSYVTLSGDNYGLALGDLQYVHVKDCIVGGLSHSLATGSIPGIGAIVNRFFIYENIKVQSPKETTLNTSIEIDVHAGAEKYVYKNINLPDFSCDTGGYDMLIENCSFYNISTSFHAGGLHVRNCNVRGFIGTLLYFDNPWRDYSKEVMIIENSKVNNIEIDPQVNTLPNFENIFRLEQLIIRNCIINDNIYIRYYPAKYLVIENNTIKSKTSVYESLLVTKRLIKPNEESFIIIKNNQIFCNVYGIGIGYTQVLYEGLDKFGKVVIDGNEIIAKEGFNSVGGIFIADTGDAIIKNNKIDVNSNGIYVVDNKKLLIDYNYVTENASYAVINTKNGKEAETLHEIGRNNNFKSLITLRYANNIKMPFGYNGWLKYIEANLSANDYGYKYQLWDDTKEELTWNGKKWLTSDKKINGKRSGTESNRPTIKVQDISKGETVEVGDLGANDFGYEYLEKNGTTFKKIVFSRVLLDEVMTHRPSSDTFIENPYKNGQIYYCNSYGTPGYNVYFAKNNTDKEIGNMIKITVKDGFFVAPDENEYPYVYALGGGYFYTRYVRLWTETDGASVGVIRRGTSENRPNGRDIYIGFQYIDTTLGKFIYASAITKDTVTWVDATGTTV